MALTLVLGPANSAKAGELLGAYAAASRSGALLVLPTAADAAHYRRELAEQHAVLASAVTFAGLTETIAARAGYVARRLTESQRQRVVQSAVRSVSYAAIGQSASAPGFAGAAGELIAELQRSLVTPQRFAQAIGRWAAEDPRRDAYARDLAATYIQYDRELVRLGRVDRDLFAWRALDALRSAPARWGGEPVFFYGFDDMTVLERDAVETLARNVGVEVMVSLTCEAGRAALSARAELVEELRAVAERVLELPAVDDYYEPRSRAALHHLERGLFEPSGPSEPLHPGEAIRLLEAAGERAEAELVAAEVIGVLQAGIPAEEIAVVHRSLAAGGAVLAQVFSEYGIPLALESRVAFGNTALGHALLALARCGLPGLARAGAADLLAYLRYPGMLERIEIADALELRIRCEGLRTVAQARECVPLSLGELDALSRARDPAAELIRNGRRLLALLGRGRAPLLDRDAQLDARALATMVRALGELAELGGSVGGEELIELLAQLEVVVPAGPVPGAVLASEPLAIRARRFRVVFVCGLQEGEFPRTASPEPFLSDERRRELAGASGLRLRRRDDALERDRYLFYSAVSRATEQVVLSYRSSDEEGNLQLASPFVADVAELLDAGWVQRRRRRLLTDPVWPLADAPTARERARAQAAAIPAAGTAPDATRRLGEQALARVRHAEVVSAGALENFAQCPVKWLVERELRPTRLAPEPDPIARGSYMHVVLEEVLRELGSAVTTESLPRALELLGEVVGRASSAVARGRPERVREAALGMIEADLRRYLEHEAATGNGWAPAHLELRFGFEGEEASLAPLVLAEEPARVAMRGAIDRVDVDPDGRRAVVRDYKSGAARIEHQGGRWDEEGTLQVALYMLAVRELLELEPVAGLYQPLGGRDLRARGVFLKGAGVGDELVGTDAREPDELEAELELARARAVALAAQLRDGELTPCPASCSRDGCRYPGICWSA